MRLQQKEMAEQTIKDREALMSLGIYNEFSRPKPSLVSALLTACFYICSLILQHNTLQC